MSVRGAILVSVVLCAGAAHAAGKESPVAGRPVPQPRIVNGLPTSGFPTVGSLNDSLGSFCTASGSTAIPAVSNVF